MRIILTLPFLQVIKAVCDGLYYTILLSKSWQLIDKIRRAPPENCDNFEHLLDPVTIATTMAFLLPGPGVITVLQREFKNGL